VVVRTAQEPEAIREDLQRSFAIHQPVQLHPFLENIENQVLLLQARDFLDVLAPRGLDQFGHRQPLQFRQVAFGALRSLQRFLQLANRLPAPIRFLRQLFRQRERFAFRFDFPQPRSHRIVSPPLLRSRWKTLRPAAVDAAVDISVYAAVNAFNRHA